MVTTSMGQYKASLIPADGSSLIRRIQRGGSGKQWTRSMASTSPRQTLFLNKDQSFQQELSRDGKVERTQGSWRRLGEGGVVFSKEFLKVSGQEIRPDGQAAPESRWAAACCTGSAPLAWR